MLFDLLRPPLLICHLKTCNERIPNGKDSDYFDSYVNIYWRPTPWYNRFFNFIYRFLYFITGPKFIVPILGNVPVKLNFCFFLSLRLDIHKNFRNGNQRTIMIAEIPRFLVPGLIFEMNIMRTYRFGSDWIYSRVETQLL